LKYLFIAHHKKTWPIDVICRLLGVTRSGFYHYQKRCKLADPLHNEMLDWVKKVAESSHYSYGSRRMKHALNALGYPVGRYKARKLMEEAGVRARYRKKYKVTTNSKHKQPIFENILNRQFVVDQTNQAYAGDITYIWTQEGWLYLAVVIDLFSRKVVGWSMSSRMKASLACDALQMALWRRHPNTGLLVHTDRGVQYASKEYRGLLTAHGCVGSMSRKGNCWDNGVPRIICL
jgi:putative transposase